MSENDAFEAFNRNKIQKKDNSLETLIEYQKHYMKLVKEYREEIDFIDNKLRELRKEQEDFYKIKIVEISKVLEEENVEDEAKIKWIKELHLSMSTSYKMSERLINSFAIKSIDEFRRKADDIIRGL